jgi:hypothetical protein
VALAVDCLLEQSDERAPLRTTARCELRSRATASDSVGT